MSDTRPARGPGGLAPSRLGTLSPGRFPLLPAAAGGQGEPASRLLVAQLSRRPSGLCHKTRSLLQHPPPELTLGPLCSSVQTPSGSKTRVSPWGKGAALRCAIPVRREAGGRPGRMFARRPSFLLGTPHAPGPPGPLKKLFAPVSPGLCLSWSCVNGAPREVPVLGPALVPGKQLLAVVSGEECGGIWAHGPVGSVSVCAGGAAGRRRVGRM